MIPVNACPNTTSCHWTDPGAPARVTYHVTAVDTHGTESQLSWGDDA